MSIQSNVLDLLPGRLPCDFLRRSLKIACRVSTASFGIQKLVIDGEFVGAGVDHVFVESSQVEGVAEPQLGVYIELKREGV